MEDKKNVLFISDDDSYVGRVLLRNIQNAGFEVIKKGTGIESYYGFTVIPKIIIVYLTENVLDYKPAVKNIYDKIKDNCQEYALLVVGDKYDSSVISEVVPHGVITDTFERPVNIKVFVENLERVYAENKPGAVYKKKILVVDDEIIFLRTMENLLSKYYDIHVVTSGVEAINFLTRFPVDLVLLDYEMPSMNGEQLIQMLKSEASTALIPVMFLTSKNDKDIVKTVLEHKPQGYVLKSLPLDDISNHIDDFFRSKIS